MKEFDQEIVSGSILRSVWKLSWPIVCLNLINGLHGFVDHVLIGHFVGSAENAGNAAVGISWQVFLVVVVLIASLFHGMNVLIARYAGRQDRHTMSRVFQDAFLSSIYILVFIMAPLGYFLAPSLLDFVNAEEAVQAHALPYLRILFTCGTPLFLMFMLTGAFQAAGEPRIPLKLGMLTTTLNILISTVLITGAGPFPKLGVLGAALGTVLAPWAGVFIAIYLIYRRKTIIQPPERIRLLPSSDTMRTIVRIGLPTGIQGVLLNLGGVFLLRYIGLLEHSAAAQAAYTICYAQLFSVVTWTSFGLRAAAGALMGQNMGAGQNARGKKGVAVAAAIGGAWAAVVGVVFWTSPEPLLSLFDATGEPILSYGVSLLRYLGVSGLMLAATLALTGGLQGAGETKIPMFIAFLTQFLLLLGICQVFLGLGMLTPSRIWMSILISHTARLLLTLAVFRTEKWVHTEVEVAPSP